MLLELELELELDINVILSPCPRPSVRYHVGTNDQDNGPDVLLNLSPLTTQYSYSSVVSSFIEYLSFIGLQTTVIVVSNLPLLSLRHNTSQ